MYARNFTRCNPPIAAAESGRDRRRQFVPHREEIFHWPVVALRPDMRAGAGVDELRGDPEPLAVPLDAALEHVLDPKLSAHLAHIVRLALVDEARIAGDDEQLAEPGEGWR